MKDRDHDHLPWLLPIEDDVRELAHPGLSNRPVHGRVHLGARRDPVERRLNLGEEPGSQTGTALFVPIDSLVELNPGLGQEPDR